jgi:PAS domain S-box-containing protein
VAAHIGRTIWEVLPEIAPVVAPDYKKVIATGIPIIDKEVRGHTKANTDVEHDYLISYYPVTDLEGAVIGVTAVVQDITAQKQAERELRQSERQFALFMQNLPAATWMKDLEGRYVYANQTAERIFQVCLNELRGKTDEQIFPAEIAEQFRSNDRSAVASGAGLQTIERLPQLDGLHYSVVNKFPIVNDEGKPVLVGGVAIDITEQRKAEDARRETEESFRVVAETAADGIVRIDARNQILFANTALGRMFGYEPQDLLGQPLTALMPEYLRHHQEASLQSYLRTRDRHLSWKNVELPGLHKSGRQIPLEISFGEFVKDGQHVFTGIIRDVTDRKRAERRLTVQYAISRILSESSNLSDIAPRVLKAIAESLEWRMGGFWMVDRAAQVMRCIETWQITSPSRSAFESKSREMTFEKGAGLPGRVWASAKATWIPHLAEDSNFRRAPFAIAEGLRSALAFPILRNLEVLGVTEFFSPEIREPDTELLQTMEIIGSQIGQFLERQSLESQVRQSQKLESLGVLAGGIAHDFNNLLTAIMGNVSLSLECLPQTHPARALLQAAVDATEDAALLTRQMLAYAGKGHFKIEPIDLSELVREIVSLIERSIHKNVQLRCDLGERQTIIEADGAQLRQVIMNLVINAAEAIGDGNCGTVVVTVRRQELGLDFLRTCLTQGDAQPGKFVVLEVRDNGCGMDPETLPRIFDPFFTTKFTGRGLGLAAVLGIVHSHKGALKVESALGVGTIFTVLFPASAVPVPATAPDTAADLAGEGTILVVDDEEIVRHFAQDCLEHYGYTVKLASNGTEAVASFQKELENISLVLLDLTMPGQSGEKTLQQLMSIRPDLKVVLSTGYNEAEATERFSGISLAGFLQKPYTAFRLAERIKSVLASEKG